MKQMETALTPHSPQLQSAWLEEMWFLPELWAWHSFSSEESATQPQNRSVHFPLPRKAPYSCVHSTLMPSPGRKPVGQTGTDTEASSGDIYRRKGQWPAFSHKLLFVGEGVVSGISLTSRE